MKSQVCIYKLHHFLFFPLLALRGLLCLGRGLVGLALDRGVVGGDHRLDVAHAHVVDRLDLQRVHDQPRLGHLGLRAVEHLGRQLLALGDDLLDSHRADDRAQVTSEDAAGENGHLILVGEEALRALTMLSESLPTLKAITALT